MQHPPLKLIFINILVGFIGMSVYSYTSNINQPQKLIETFINDSFFRHYGSPLTLGALETLYGFIASTLDIGGVIGAIFISWTAEKFGRKNGALFVNAIILSVGSAVQMGAVPARSFELLLLGRLICGISLGMNPLVYMYLTECAPTFCRGSMGTIPTVLYTVWILLGTVLGLPSLLGSQRMLPLLLGFGIIPGVLSMLVCFFLPQSPKFLFISRQNETEARKAVEYYHVTKDERKIEDALEEYRREDDLTQHMPKVGLKEIWAEPHLRHVFLLTLLIVFTSNLSGIDVATTYSNSILSSLGLKGAQGDLAVILTQLPGIIACSLCSFLIEHLGRRPIFLTALFMAIMGHLFFIFSNQLPILSLLALILIYVSHHGGLFIIANVIIGEICPQASRSLVAGVAWNLNWVGSLIITFAFPVLQVAMKEEVFILFLVPTAGVWVWGWFCFPETRQKSVHSIVGEFVDKFKAKENGPISENTPLLE